MQNNWLVYLHYKKDDLTLFYVGIAKQHNNRRAKSVHSRNKIWKNIVNKHGFIFKIVATNLSSENACELEEFIINLFGRLDVKTGILANVTDGGEGVRGYIVSDKQKIEHSIRMKGKNNPNYNKPMSRKQREQISRTRKTKRIAKGGNNPKSILVLNIENGIFYDCIKHASIAYNVKYPTLKSSFQRGYNLKYNLIKC